MTKDFKGHFEPADPRNVVWGAGGCVWPTVPPYRWRLGSQNAVPPWDSLATTGVLLEADTPQNHDDVIWRAIADIPPMLDDVWIWKHYDRATQDIRWTLFFNHPGYPQAFEITQLIPGPQRCNDTVEIDNGQWGYGYPSPGDPISIWQTYFNELLPLEGWPPWE